MKDEIYRVAGRHGVPVSVVAGNFIRVPQDPLIERIAAGAGMDAADDWIAERARPGDIVMTSDIPLASRCVKAGADVIAPNGKPFTEGVDRDDAGGAQSDDGSALGRRGHRRPEIVRAARPLGVPLGARPDAAPDPAPPRRPGRDEPELSQQHGATADPTQRHQADLRRHAAAVGRRAVGVAPSERVCLIGRNGSGKSTLLKIAAGLVEPDGGSRFVQPGATIRYLPQEPDFGEPHDHARLCRGRPRPGDDHYQARYLLEQLGLHGDEDPANVSGGEARRAALARVLAPSPDILLLDEPTNHLDLPTIEWLESELDSRRGALVIISHDRRFLTNLSRSTAWLDRGKIRQIDRGFAAFEAWRDEVLAEEERDQHKLDRKIVNEEHWLRYGVSGRRKRNVKRLGNLHALRDQRRNYRGAAGTANLAAAEAEKSGKLVIEAKGISQGLWRPQDRRQLLDPRPARRPHRHRRAERRRQDHADRHADRRRSRRIPAACGSAPTSRWRRSTSIAKASIPKSTLADALTGGRGDHVMVGGKPKHVVSYMKDFLFAQEQRARRWRCSRAASAAG